MEKIRNMLHPDVMTVTGKGLRKEDMIRPFDCEEDALNAVLTHKIQPGDAVIIRYEGSKGSGMPEMFYTTEAIASDPLLASTIALLTDLRQRNAAWTPPKSMKKGLSGQPLFLSKRSLSFPSIRSCP